MNYFKLYSKFIILLLILKFNSTHAQNCASNVKDGGTITTYLSSLYYPSYTNIYSTKYPSNINTGIKYIWIMSTTGIPSLSGSYKIIEGETKEYLTIFVGKTTWVKRLAISNSCPVINENYVESNWVKIEVQNPDNTPPKIFKCPDPIVVFADNNQTCKSVTYPYISSYDESGIKSSTTNYPNNYCFPIGTTFLLYKVEDNAGNTSYCSSNVSVRKNYCPTKRTSTECNYRINLIRINGKPNEGKIEFCKGQWSFLDLNFMCSIPLDPYWNIYIDFNQDGDFTDDNENVLHLFTPTGLLGTSIQIPENVMTGITKMRITAGMNKYITSCEDYTNGAVVDYDINIMNCNQKSEQILGVYDFDDKTKFTAPTINTNGYPVTNFTNEAVIFSGFKANNFYVGAPLSNTFQVFNDKNYAVFTPNYNYGWYFEEYFNSNHKLTSEIKSNSNYTTTISGFSWEQKINSTYAYDYVTGKVGYRIYLNNTLISSNSEINNWAHQVIKLNSPITLNVNDVLRFELILHEFNPGNQYNLNDFMVLGNVSPKSSCAYMSAGEICCIEEKCSAFDPSNISEKIPVYGSDAVSYMWQSTQDDPYGYPYQNITNIYSNTTTYDPATISKTTWYRRLAKPSNCIETNPNYYVKSNWIKKSTTLCSEGRATSILGLDSRYENNEVKLNYFADLEENLEVYYTKLERVDKDGNVLEVLDHNVDLSKLEDLTDKKPIEGDNYYRMVSVTAEKKIFSNITKVFYKKLDDNTFLYPNPTTGSITLILDKYIGENLTIKVFNNFGHQVYVNKILVASDKFNLDLSTNFEGQYLIYLMPENRQPIINKVILLQD